MRDALNLKILRVFSKSLNECGPWEPVTRIEQGSTRLFISSCEKTPWRYFWTDGDENSTEHCEDNGEGNPPKIGKIRGSALELRKKRMPQMPKPMSHKTQLNIQGVWRKSGGRLRRMPLRK
jgi:hypothetical protein